MCGALVWLVHRLLLKIRLVLFRKHLVVKARWVVMAAKQCLEQEIWDCGCLAKAMVLPRPKTCHFSGVGVACQEFQYPWAVNGPTLQHMLKLGVGTHMVEEFSLRPYLWM